MGGENLCYGNGLMKSSAATPRSSGFNLCQYHLRGVVFVLTVGATMLLGGCSLLPGMFVVPGKQPIVTESPEEPASVDYTLLKITPMLVRELIDEHKGRSQGNNKLPFSTSDSYPYRLGPQDALRIFVWGNPDLTPISTNVTTTNVATTPAGRTIDEQGNIFFPLVGTIKASGLTVSQFRAALSKSLSRYIKDPQVEVDVAGFRSQKVFVSGQVKNPGVVPITDQPLRVTDALGLAGGATDNSDLYGVVLTRGKVSTIINVDRLYYNGDLSSNILLQNGDIITVPDRSMRKVFVLGEVGNASGVNQARSYIMRRGNMTLTEVISDAGGPSPFSSAANEIYVMRAGKDGKPVVYVLDSLQPQALVLAEQFPIEPRDVIFVNPTGLTMVGRFIGQFLPIVQSVSTAATTPF